MTDVNQGMPQVSGPLTNPDGTVSQAWWAFFRSLWVRTGSGAGLLIDDLALILALNQARDLPGDPQARAEALLAALLALRPVREPIDYTTPELFALGLRAPPVRSDLDEAKLFALSLTRPPPPFIGLTDVPGSYVGHAGKFVAVKATENGLEFVDGGGGGGSSWIPLANGAEPPSLITDGAGHLALVAFA